MKKTLIALALVSLNAFAVTMPDPVLTPGVVDPSLTAKKLCDKKFKTTTVRNVSESVKNQVYKNYNVKNHQGYCSGPEGCEIDHLISLELGGSNDIGNLWPQPYNDPEGAHMKDKLENKLHALVCAGKIPLGVAQHEIATDWKAAYKKYMGQ